MFAIQIFCTIELGVRHKTGDDKYIFVSDIIGMKMKMCICVLYTNTLKLSHTVNDNDTGIVGN